MSESSTYPVACNPGSWVHLSQALISTYSHRLQHLSAPAVVRSALQEAPPFRLRPCRLIQTSSEVGLLLPQDQQACLHSHLCDNLRHSSPEVQQVWWKCPAGGRDVCSTWEDSSTRMYGPYSKGHGPLTLHGQERWLL